MILKNLTKNYTTIPNELIIDTSISEKAFRLYCYLAAKPQSWEINNKDIMKQLNIGSNNSLAKYWNELINSGWIEKQREKDKTGKFTGKTLIILHENRNRKSCENGEEPKSQTNRNRKSCEIAKSAIHNKTEYTNNTDINNKKEKKENNQQIIENLSNKIISLLKENNLPIKSNTKESWKVVLLNLLKEGYNEKVISEAIEYASEDKFYIQYLPYPNRFKNNIDAIVVKANKEKKEETYVGF